MCFSWRGNNQRAHPSPTSGQSETERICVIERSNRQNKVWPIALAMWWSVSHCISLFIEPRVSKARAGELEERERSRRSCRLVECLLTGAAAATADSLYPLVSWWCSGRSHNSAARASLVELNWCLQGKSGPAARRAPHEAHVLCWYWPCIYKTWGRSERLCGERAWHGRLG